jgi:hypothetical protein
MSLPNPVISLYKVLYQGAYTYLEKSYTDDDDADDVLSKSSSSSARTQVDTFEPPPPSKLEASVEALVKMIFSLRLMYYIPRVFIS